MLRMKKLEQSNGDNSRGSNLLRSELLRLETITQARGIKARFAAAAGLSAVELSHLLSGRRAATLRQAVSISDITAGAVPVRSWLDVADPNVRE
jgi:hypothetical protein